ncbi:dethiobiotin synthase [Desulfogranum marinum]|uniref:dethiobiotin synthase n=1 Tax=Desulfogranum marinum TaxID=453220 RepID=UPI0019654CAB|nr:dethiobiotin synthase [Desulfogranum marinum]MBM9512664.1 ATP-dependent dethiobiotin synthetase BioD [Desulfogranum marinum]
MDGHAKTLAIVGIDTDVGKSVVTGLIARHLHLRKKKVTTLKLVQTGCTNQSDDILLHRKLMGIPLTKHDEQGITCPYLFPLPASPKLAAKQAKKTIEAEVLDQATQVLQNEYEWLLVEGAGGLLVPLSSELLLLDYLKEKKYPLVLVTSSKLGSINHTRLSLEAIKNRQIQLLGLVYNLHNPSTPAIVQDSLNECRRALKEYGMDSPVIIMPDTGETQSINWTPLLATLV